jgi:DNA-binding winged helix-turn-helix (wHTH) protein/pimeloyl-ACP methyl ester carboxylesterase
VNEVATLRHAAARARQINKAFNIWVLLDQQSPLLHLQLVQAAAGAVNEVATLRQAAARTRHMNRAFNIWVLLDLSTGPESLLVRPASCCHAGDSAGTGRTFHQRRLTARQCQVGAGSALPWPLFPIAVSLILGATALQEGRRRHGGAHLAFRFGGFVLDPERRELRSDAKLLAVEPQVLDLLVFLVRNRDRVISRDELLSGVWGGRIVSDSAIGARINAARRAIGDDGEQQRSIRTFARKGFRFVGEVHEEPEPARAGSPTAPVDPAAAHAAARAQEVKFCRTKDGVNIAYASVGEGTPVVRASHWMNHIEHEWQNPFRMPFLHFLADRFRLIRYDGRNNGLSDWNVADMSFEARQLDLEAVVDALSLRSYVLLGPSQGAAISIVHAARYPERVSKLIIHGGFAQGRARREGSRKGLDQTALFTLMLEGWGDENSVFRKAFSLLYLPNGSAEQIKGMADLQRVASSPENAVRSRRVLEQIDVVDLLPKLSMPTLVTHCRHDQLVPFEEGRRIATLIPYAKFVPLESANHVPQPGEPAWPIFLDTIESFLSEN